MCLSGRAGLTGLLLWSQVPDLVVHEEEVYEDEDDENDEANWRNDYPDEESDADDDREERYGGEFARPPSDRRYSDDPVEQRGMFSLQIIGRRSTRTAGAAGSTTRGNCCVSSAAATMKMKVDACTIQTDLRLGSCKLLYKYYLSGLITLLLQ